MEKFKSMKICEIWDYQHSFGRKGVALKERERETEMRANFFKSSKCNLCNLNACVCALVTEALDSLFPTQPIPFDCHAIPVSFKLSPRKRNFPSASSQVLSMAMEDGDREETKPGLECSHIKYMVLTIYI